MKKRLISRNLGRYGIAALLLIMTVSFITTSSAQAVNLLSLEEMRLIKGGDGFCGEGWCTDPPPINCQDYSCTRGIWEYYKIIGYGKHSCKSGSSGEDCVETSNECGKTEFHSSSDCSDPDPWIVKQYGYVCD